MASLLVRGVELHIILSWDLFLLVLSYRRFRFSCCSYSWYFQLKHQSSAILLHSLCIAMMVSDTGTNQMDTLLDLNGW